MEQKFRVLGSKIVVLPIEDKDTVIEEGKLIIPEQLLKKERIIRGRVVAVGPKVEGLEVGDELLYERFVAQEVTHEDVLYQIIGHIDQVHIVF